MKLMLYGFAAAALLAGPARAGDGGCAGEAQAITDAVEAKVQTKVLDPLLGRGAAYAFLDLKVQLDGSWEEQSRSGTGETHVLLPGEDAAKGGNKTLNQTAVQGKGSSEKKTVLKLAPAAMKLRVLHDSALAAEKLRSVREALLALFPGALKTEDLVFVPAEFAKQAQ